MNTEFKIIVCPNDEKIKILENLNKNSELYNVKFMSKEEFIKNYFFDYTVDTIYYLMDKYKFNLDPSGNGYSNYKGTAFQNLALINLAKKGKLKK